VSVETKLYELLGVSSNASEGANKNWIGASNSLISDVGIDEIKKAYRKKVVVFFKQLLPRLTNLAGERTSSSS
jgi:curved DNA-binding protein CbpA